MDKARLDEVKRRNKILQACKEWENNGIKISINDFYDLHTTLQLQEKKIAKLDELDSQKKYIICKNKEEIEDFLNYTNKVICKSMKYAFFVANATKLGALKLQGNIISNNIEYVISKSEFVERFPELSLFFKAFSLLNSEMICIFPYFCPCEIIVREIGEISFSHCLPPCREALLNHA